MSEVRPNRSKAEFRALREMAGLTQQTMADVLGVKILSIKRWESPKYPQQAPADAWSLLDLLCDAQAASCSRALVQVAQSGVSSAVLPYWSSAEEWSQSHPEMDITWTEANATSRRVGAVLFARDVRVTWTSEDGATVDIL